MTGFPKIFGGEARPQSLRTRMGHRIAQELMRDAESGTFVSSERVRHAVLGARVLSAELYLDSVLQAQCVHSGDEIARACAVLRAWGRRGSAFSAGAHLWDAFWEEVQRTLASELLSIPFDATNPVETPAGMNASHPGVLAALKAAVGKLDAAGISLDARREDY